MKEDYISKETTRKASITELEGLIRQIEEVSIKVNTNFQILQDAFDVYRRNIKQNEETKNPISTVHIVTTQHNFVCKNTVSCIVLAVSL